MLNPIATLSLTPTNSIQSVDQTSQTLPLSITSFPQDSYVSQQISAFSSFETPSKPELSHKKATRTPKDENACPSGQHRASATKAKTPAGDLENSAAEQELRQQDQLRAEEIYTRMKAERTLHVARMQAMIANLQTEIQRIWEEVIIRRQKIHDDLMGKWEKVLFT